MSKNNKAARVLSNSASISVNFAKEVSGLMADQGRAFGRELKLAVAIYHAPEAFKISDILGGNGAKKRKDGMKAALASHSEDFAAQVAQAKAKMVNKPKSMADYAKRADAESINKVVTAAITMFERALVDAYLFQSGGCVVEKLTDKSVKLRFTRAVTIDGKDYEVGLTDLFTRKSVHELGLWLARNRGILAKAATPALTGAGEVTTPKQRKVITDSAATLAKLVKPLTGDARADVTMSAEFETLLATSIRSRFSADGAIDVAEIIAFLRQSDEMQGVRIISAMSDAVAKQPRKPAKAA